MIYCEFSSCILIVLKLPLADWQNGVDMAKLIYLISVVPAMKGKCTVIKLAVQTVFKIRLSRERKSLIRNIGSAENR